jgi:exopolysaccharide biosynthesis polyprenyl glycosylphosphotransferase
MEQLPVSVHIVTHIASDLVDDVAQHRLSNIGSVGMIDVKKKPLSDWAPTIKRVEDTLVAGILLFATVPLFPLIALAIKLDSPGPIFYSQRRRGLNHRVMNILKFRTMHVTETDAEVRQAEKGDARVTRIGRVLRRTSLDELPQLFNVLKGEMSMVGPRPHALVHDEKYGEMLEQYASRHQVKPGITGLAQVTGHRGETPTSDSMEARVNQDIHYIKNWSLWLDIKILLQTAWVVIIGKNAY